ncbi:MAG: hypothetical protein ACI93L_003427 [Cyclobacteriaceae bacterium]|jgi:hypothetical protein
MKKIAPLILIIMFSCNKPTESNSEQAKETLNEIESGTNDEIDFNFHLQGIWYTEGNEGVVPNWIEFDTVHMSYSNWNNDELKSNSLDGEFLIINNSILEVRFTEYNDIQRYYFDSLTTYFMVLSPLGPNAGDLTFIRKKYENPKIPTYEALELSIEISDTIKLQSNSLIFRETDSTSFKPYYDDQSVRSELTSTEGNWHKRAKIIEDYLDSTHRFGEFFDANDSTLTLNLLKDSTLTLPKWNYSDDYGYNLEHFFKAKQLYLIRIQYSEGNSWMLVNRKSGQITYIEGLPYFSPSNSHFVTIGLDMEAGYNMNGIQYFKYSQESISKIWQLNILNWGPRNIKWQNDSTLIVQRTYWLPNTKMEYINDHSNLTIR